MNNNNITIYLVGQSTVHVHLNHLIMSFSLQRIMNNIKIIILRNKLKIVRNYIKIKTINNYKIYLKKLHHNNIQYYIKIITNYYEYYVIYLFIIINHLLTQINHSL